MVCQALHYTATHDQLSMPNIAGCELFHLRRQLIVSAHEFNPDMPDYGAADDFMGSHEHSRGAVIDPERIAFAGRQEARAKVLEQARKGKEERSLCVPRSSDSKGAGKHDGGGPEADGDKPATRARGKK